MVQLPTDVADSTSVSSGAEFIAGAEEEPRRLTRRPMTADELARVLRYPADV